MGDGFWFLFGAFVALLGLFVKLAYTFGKVNKQNKLYRVKIRDHAEAMNKSCDEVVEIIDNYLEMRDIAKEALLRSTASPEIDALQNRFAKEAARFDKNVEKYGFDPEAVKQL